MATCAAAVPRSVPDAREVRVLRWVFKRATDAITCELGLTGHDSAYELRVTRPSSASGVVTELFDDAMAAFQRHAVIERALVRDGWFLDSFESDRRRA